MFLWIAGLALLTLCLIVFVVLLWGTNKLLKKLYRESSESVQILHEECETLKSEQISIKERNAQLGEFLAAEKTASKEMVTIAAGYEAQYHALAKKYGEEVILSENLKKEILGWKEVASKSLSERKASEVRTGKIAEHFAALMETFPYPLDTATFHGMPIDLICYCEDGIHFVEIKTGGADLTSKQRQIRDLINAGKVSFEVYRMRARD